MADVHDKATRSKNNLPRLYGMAAIKSKDTKPEMVVQSSLYKGFSVKKETIRLRL
jgi:G:T-mismatch repair DNA endonuclease (very short patch repair protein)